MTTKPASQSAHEDTVTSAAIGALIGADPEAWKLRAGVLNAAERAQSAMQANMPGHTREQLTRALRELDGLEARLAELTAPSARDYAATHSIVCAHADDDGIGSHILAPGEKCDCRAAER